MSSKPSSSLFDDCKLRCQSQCTLECPHHPNCEIISVQKMLNFTTGCTYSPTISYLRAAPGSCRAHTIALTAKATGSNFLTKISTGKYMDQSTPKPKNDAFAPSIIKQSATFSLQACIFSSSAFPTTQARQQLGC